MKKLLQFLTALLVLSCQAIDNHSAARLKSSSHFIVIKSDRDTLLKFSPNFTREDEHEADEGMKFCKLFANTNLHLAMAPELTSDRHFKISLSSPLPGCELTEGFISMTDAETSLPVEEVLSPTVKAFLDTIAYAEGTEDSYNYIYTHTRFYSYRNHPRAMRCSGGLCSDAAGRYQFLSSTWKYLSKKANLKDFSPLSQDIACLQLIEDEGYIVDVRDAANYASFERAVYGLSKQWASLPGAPYGQPVKTMDELWRYFQTRLST